MGPKAHHKQNWTREDGLRRLGFTIAYNVTKGQDSAPSQSWDSSTIFALVVMLLAALTLAGIAFVMYRQVSITQLLA